MILEMCKHMFVFLTYTYSVFIASHGVTRAAHRKTSSHIRALINIQLFRGLCIDVMIIFRACCWLKVVGKRDAKHYKNATDDKSHICKPNMSPNLTKSINQ
jgi:hypothetical protein